MTLPSAEEEEKRGWLLIAMTIGWIVVFSYLLLTSDPPEIGPVHLRSFEDPGHLFGSLLLGLLVFLVLIRWEIRPRRAAPLSLGTTLAFLFGLEYLQELRPGRGYQQLDIQLNLIGAVAGVALAWAATSVRQLLRPKSDRPTTHDEKGST